MKADPEADGVNNEKTAYARGEKPTIGADP
jgi:hypothetical protein